MKKYKAKDLISLVMEMAEESASSPEVLTATHLLYAYLCLFTMPRQEILAEVGGDEKRNARVLAALELAWRAVRDEDKLTNLAAYKTLVWSYLPIIEQRKGVEEQKVHYETILRLLAWDKGSEQGMFPEEYLECKYFCQLLQLISTTGFATEYIERREKAGNPLTEEESNMIAETVLRHRDYFRNIAQEEGAQIVAAGLQKESETKVSEQIKRLQQALETKIVGQDLAVKSFLNVFKRAHYFKNRKGKPLAVYLLAGPPGVGKTFLAETTAKALDMPYKRFDMSEYGIKHDAEGLVGFEPSWKDAAPGVLTGYVESNPQALILFDEIEKAHSSVLNLFLQVLNDGQLTDKYTARTISFEKTILIFTTNAGRELYQDNYEENLSALPVNTIVSALQEDESFPNELISRFASNSIIMFNHINKMNLMDIAMNSMERVRENVKREIVLENAELLAQLLLLHEGEKNDARMITAKAEDMVSQALMDYMDYEVEQDMTGEYPIHITVSEETNEAGKYLFYDKKNPVRVLYLTDKKIPKLKWKVDVRKHFEPELLGNKDYSYQIVVIDPSCGMVTSDKNKKILELDSEGNQILREILKHSGRSSIYVADDGLLESEERRYLFREGIAGILPTNPETESWRKIMTRHYIVRSQEMLANEGKIVDYRVVSEIGRNSKGRICGRIIFQNFSLGNAVINDAKTREFDKDTMMSAWERPQIRFEDVIGAENAKRELQHFIKYVKKSEYYDMMGLNMPRGVLLYGPPGTGKTMLAKAAAGESGVSFIAVSASDFAQQYVGAGEQKIRDIFAVAKRNSPAILFIDEIDTIGKERTGSESTQHTEKLLNTLLTEMDGFSELRKQQVFVMAATNFDIDGTKSGKRVRIDPALTRRFPTQIYVDLPSREERMRYVKMYLEKKGAKSGIVDMKQIDNMAESMASQTVGQSLAIVENMLDYSLRQFAMNRDELPQNEKLTEALLLEYVQEMQYGEKTNSPKISTAYHEAAHAFMAWKVGETPAFLTIVSRDEFGGYVQMKDSECTKHTEKSMRNQIKISLAGRVGEMMYYKYYADGAGEAELLKEAVNTGAGSDLKYATYYAKQIVAGIGRSNDSLAIIPEDMRSVEMNCEILEEVNLLLKVEMDRTIQIAEENRELIHKLALEAIDKTQLTEKQILKVLEGYESRL